MTERRLTPRWKVERPAALTLEDGTRRECVVEDMSLKGLCLRAAELPSAPLFRLSLTLDDLVLNVEARVVWRRDQDQVVSGILFQRIRDNDKDRIFSYLREHFPEQLKKMWWGEAATSMSSSGSSGKL